MEQGGRILKEEKNDYLRNYDTLGKVNYTECIVTFLLYTLFYAQLKFEDLKEYKMRKKKWNVTLAGGKQNLTIAIVKSVVNMPNLLVYSFIFLLIITQLFTIAQVLQLIEKIESIEKDYTIANTTMELAYATDMEVRNIYEILYKCGCRW